MYNNGYISHVTTNQQLWQHTVIYVFYIYIYTCITYIYMYHIYIHVSHIYIYIHVSHIYIHVSHIYIHVSHIYIHVSHIYIYMYHIYIHVSHIYIYIHVSHIYTCITYIYIHVSHIYIYIHVSHIYMYMYIHSYISGSAAPLSGACGTPAIRWNGGTSWRMLPCLAVTGSNESPLLRAAWISWGLKKWENSGRIVGKSLTLPWMDRKVHPQMVH